MPSARRSLVLTGVQLEVVLPGPALKQGAVDDQLSRGVQVLHRRYRDLEGLGDQGRVGADDAGDGGLGDAVELGEQLLGQVVAQVGQGQSHAQEQPQHPRPEDRRIGVLGENGLAQAHNLTPRDSRTTIRHGGLLLGWIGLSTKDSLKSKPPPCLATRYYQQNTLNTPMNKRHCLRLLCAWRPGFSNCAVRGDGVSPDFNAVVGRQLAFDSVLSVLGEIIHSLGRLINYSWIRQP